jgi:dinuclear metal center YbgI/SA1388 family protein
MKVKDIISCLEARAPIALQEPYDNTGLLIGNPDSEIEGALICLDLTMEVMDEAITEGLGMVISHHPLVFSGMKKLTGSNDTERIVIKAVKHDIVVFAIHTNLDNVHDGVNAKLCEKLGVTDPKILRPMSGKLNKLVTFCPKDHADKVRKALFEAGAGHIGNYGSCSFNLEGYGTFRAGEGSHPFVGELGKLHRENEIRIEMIFPDYLRGKLLASLMATHPYEEVAYDIYPLMNESARAGAGMIGMLDKPMDEKLFLEMLKNILGSGVIRHSALCGKKISKLAVCGGSGSFLIGDALRSGADAFVSGDIKYHQFFEAEGKMLIADAGHFETEQFTKELIYNILNEKFPTFALRISRTNTNAVHYL